MKIGLLNATEAWGGGERWFFDAGVALAARGHDVFIAGSEHGALLARVRERTETTPTSLDTTSLDAIPIDRLTDRIAAAQPDVLLCNSRREVRDAIRALGKRRDVPIALRRGIDRPLHDHPLRRRQWKRLAAILVNSDATGRTVRRSLGWFPVDRIRRIYNPVSLDMPGRIAATDGRIRIGAVARLVRQKGIEYLIDATARLASHDTARPLTVEIAGDGKLRAKLEKLAARRSVDDRCRFLGHVDDLPSFYARQDVIVIPSLYEGFCFVAAEAALAGLPVIASRVSSLVELVDDKETGWLVPAGDADAIADAVRTVTNDPNRAAAMGAAARERAIERFAPDPIFDEVEAWLAEVRNLDPVA